MKYIKPFDEIRHHDSAIFGGKAAALGEMTHADIPVPPGFGVSIEAHRDFANSKFSDEFINELQTAFSRLGIMRVAVRSSAVAEDGTEASWAGQLESYLNVEKDYLEESIRKCWQSVTADHVIDYASDKQLDEDSLLVGVVVQAMVDSEVSGVMFTVNPVTKHVEDLVIEGSFGLGEMVVQGIVTPDNFHFDKKAMNISEYNISIKHQMMVYQNGDNRIIDVPTAKADRAVFRPSQIEELALIGMQIERYFVAPQDIEWAYSDNEFYIVQARPITTLT